MAKIFISYRREDSQWPAHSLYNEMRPYVENPDEDIFIDVDNIPLGVNFAEYLDEKVAQCEIILVLIGPDWLNAKNQAGQRRLDDPNDFVRIEIASALSRKISVVPVLLDGAAIPSPDNLPENIRELSLRNGVEVRRASFTGDVERLIKGLRLSRSQTDFGDEDWQIVSQKLEKQRYTEFAASHPRHPKAAEAKLRAKCLTDWGTINASDAEAVLAFRKQNQQLLARFDALQRETKAQFDRASKSSRSAPRKTKNPSTQKSSPLAFLLIVGALLASFRLDFYVSDGVGLSLLLSGFLPIIAAYAGLSSNRGAKIFVAILCLLSAPVFYLQDSLSFGGYGLPIAVVSAMVAMTELRNWRPQTQVSSKWIILSILAITIGVLFPLRIQIGYTLHLGIIDIGLIGLGLFGVTVMSGLKLRAILAIVLGLSIVLLFMTQIIEPTDGFDFDDVTVNWSQFDFSIVSTIFCLIAAACLYFAFDRGDKRPNSISVYTIATLGLLGAFLSPYTLRTFDPMLWGNIGDSILFGTAMAQTAGTDEIIVTATRRTAAYLPGYLLVFAAAGAIGTTLRQQGAKSPIAGVIFITGILVFALTIDLLIMGSMMLNTGFYLTSLLSFWIAFSAPWKRTA